jgi:polar amino acid transport system substrate-binding protein
MSKTKSLLFLLVIAALLLAACGGAPANNSGANTGDTGEDMAGEEAMVDHTTVCGDVDPGDLPDLGGQEVVMAVENAYPPFNSLDDNGNGVGWDYDAGAAICELLNCVPSFTEAAWDGIFPAMAAGEYDVLFDGVTYTTERDQTVDFSCAYVTIGQVLLVNAGEDRFSTPDEFAAGDFTVATQLGTTNEIVAHDFVGVDRTKSFEDFGLAVQAVLSGDADAVVIDTVSAVGFIQENPGALMIIQPGITSDEQLALVFPPGSALIDPFTNALHKMAKDGTLKSLNDKWFNP